MKQILQSYKSGELWLAETPVPLCGAKGLLVQTRASFVSAGTEKMLVDFAKKNIVGKAIAMPDQVKKVIRKMKAEGIMSTLEKVQTKLDQPIPLGYSSAGIVEEVGNDVTGFTVGDRVACGGAGFANHAEYNYVPKNLVVKIPQNVTFETASCATVGSIALQGIRQCDVRLGETVCVMGLGLLGILAVQMLKAGGAKVIGFDPNPVRCALAKKLGADTAVSENLAGECQCLSEGYGVDSVLITAATKSSEPVTLAGEICKMRGRVVVTGMVGMDIPRDMYYKKELDFKLSLSYGPGRYDVNYEEKGNDYPFGYVRWTEQRNIKAFLDLAAQGKIKVPEMVTHRFDINDALNAYEILLGKTEEPFLGIVLEYGKKGSLEKGKADTLVLEKKNVPESAMNIGFIGAGNFAKSVLFPTLRKMRDVNLIGLCDASGMNASETAKKESFQYATTDYRKIIEDKSINTVFVATPHNMHPKFVAEALKAGKHVSTEKPLAISMEGLKEVKEACRDNEGVLLVGFNRRFSSHAKLLSEYFSRRKTPAFLTYRINAGEIPAEHWIQDTAVGGGRIIGEGCHFVDFASYVIGKKPVEVQAFCAMDDKKAGSTEDNVSFNILYEDGSLANILYTAVGSPDMPKERCEIHAAGSSALMEDFSSTQCFGKLGNKALKGKQDKGFRRELEALKNSIIKGGKAPIEITSLFATTKITLAVIEAFRTKKTVKL